MGYASVACKPKGRERKLRTSHRRATARARNIPQAHRGPIHFTPNTRAWQPSSLYHTVWGRRNLASTSGKTLQCWRNSTLSTGQAYWFQVTWANQSHAVLPAWSCIFRYYTRVQMYASLHSRRASPVSFGGLSCWNRPQIDVPRAGYCCICPSCHTTTGLLLLECTCPAPSLSHFSGRRTAIGRFCLLDALRFRQHSRCSWGSA